MQTMVKAGNLSIHLVEYFAENPYVHADARFEGSPNRHCEYNAFDRAPASEAIRLKGVDFDRNNILRHIRAIG